jgi:glycosyltransferase 2 family protein
VIHSNRPANAARQPRIWQGRQLLGIVLAAVCLWVAFRNADPTTLLGVLAGASIPYILLSAAFNLVSAFVKCTKMGVLVRPITRIRYRDLFAAEMVSVLVDTIFPLRLHEFVRAYLLSRRGTLSASFVFGAEFVVKVVEALLLTGGLLALSALAVMPAWAITGIRSMVVLAWMAALFLIVMVRWPTLGNIPFGLLARVKMRGTTRVGQMITDALDGISRTAVKPSALLGVLFVTATEWLLLAGSLWSAALAVGVHLSPVELLGFLLANHLAFAVPSSTSGSIGIYEATGTMTMVLLFAMQQEEALAVVLVAHCVMVTVALLGGFTGLKLAHSSLQEIREQSLDALQGDTPD